jgi:hypothetical protein
MAPEDHLDAEKLSKVTDTLLLPSLDVPALRALARCPFHDGVATLDLLLAELDPRDSTLFDAALDLRSLCAAGIDAAACVQQLFRVRALLEERHYLAFYRVRCWARRHFRIEVHAGRGGPRITHELPLNGARLEEVINASLATLAAGTGVIPASAHVRFVLAPSTERE